MKTNSTSSHRVTAMSAIAAAIAALTLSACGPHEATEPTAVTGGAAPTVASPAAVAQSEQPNPPAAALPYQPVPPPPVAAAPTYTAPARVAQAQPSYAPNTNYAPPPNYAPTPNQAPTQYAPPPSRERVVQEQAAERSHVGSVESIEPIRDRPQGSGAGAVVGGVLGGLVGNQFGHGLGRAAVTGLGAVGGAVAGNNVERNIHEGVVGYRVSVRLDNGGTRTFERSSVGGLHVGDRVHVDSESFHRV